MCALHFILSPFKATAIKQMFIIPSFKVHILNPFKDVKSTYMNVKIGVVIKLSP